MNLQYLLMLNNTLKGDVNCKLSTLLLNLAKNSYHLCVSLLQFKSQLLAQFCSTSSFVNKGSLIPTSANQITSSVASGIGYY